MRDVDIDCMCDYLFTFRSLSECNVLLYSAQRSFQLDFRFIKSFQYYYDYNTTVGKETVAHVTRFSANMERDDEKHESSLPWR